MVETILHGLTEAVKYLVGPGIAVMVWKRLVLVRVTTHLGYIFEKPPRVHPLREVFMRGGDPTMIVVVPRRPEPEPEPEREPPMQAAIASAQNLEDVPGGVLYEEALFIRVINRSPEREVTLGGVWIETPGRRIPVDVPGGQATIRKGRRWEGWVRMSTIRENVPERADYHSCIRVRVAEKRTTLRSVQADPDEVAPAGELTTAG